MLASFFLALSNEFTWLNLFKYLTFRGILAVITSLLIGIFLFPIIIRKLQQLSIREVVREDDVPLHKGKGGTPTMGGIGIVFAVTFSTLLWADMSTRLVWIALGGFLAFALIGFIDDWYKLTAKNKKKRGLSVRHKLLLQIIVAATVACVLYMTSTSSSETAYLVPFFKHVMLDLHYWFIPLTILVLVGTSNSVNLTDGLDGLAIMPIVLVAGGLGIFSYASGNILFSEYLVIPYIDGAGELVILCGSLVGAGLAFLVFNCFPAQVFMGDTGSIALGGVLAIVAVIVRQEIVLLIMGGLFVIEALSVIVQVASYKLRGRRVWLMSPLHHHYELKGWEEPKITVRFWVMALVFVLIGLATLKIR